MLVKSDLKLTDAQRREIAEAVEMIRGSISLGLMDLDDCRPGHTTDEDLRRLAALHSLRDQVESSVAPVISEITGE